MVRYLDQTLQDPIFVGGLQRSGTTLLAALLASHPEVSGLRTGMCNDEGQFVQDVYVDDHKMGAGRLTSRGKVYRWAYHAEAHLTEADAFARSEASKRLQEAWHPYLEFPERHFMVEKSPSNLTRSRFLQACFPGARFVVITRNPVVQALAVRKWARRQVQVGISLEGVIDHWFTAMDIFRSDLPSLHTVYVLSYENLMSNPGDELRALQRGLGLPPHDLGAGAISDESSRYIQYWESIRQGKRVTRNELLNPSIRRRSAIPRGLEYLCAPIFGPRINSRIIKRFSTRFTEYGYDPVDLQMSKRWKD